ncbi:hypothetical protein LguiB_032322 [Lonicera macranthoides]
MERRQRRSERDGSDDNDNEHRRRDVGDGYRKRDRDSARVLKDEGEKGRFKDDERRDRKSDRDLKGDGEKNRLKKDERRDRNLARDLKDGSVMDRVKDDEKRDRILDRDFKVYGEKDRIKEDERRDRRHRRGRDEENGHSRREDEEERYSGRKGHHSSGNSEDGDDDGNRHKKQRDDPKDRRRDEDVKYSSEDDYANGHRHKKRGEDGKDRRKRDEGAKYNSEDEDANGHRQKKDGRKGDENPRYKSEDEDVDRDKHKRRRDSEKDRRKRYEDSKYNSEDDTNGGRHKRRSDDERERRKRDEDEKYKRDNEELKSLKQPNLPEGTLNMDTANLGRSGGVYIPPFKLARMMKEVQDKSSVEYQRMTWDALRKSINGLVNKVNATNIKNIIPELFAENLIRGRGLFCRSCMKSQMASPGFTDVFAALVAVVNTKFPEVGDLLLRRIILQLQRAYKRNDKPQLLAAVKFIAHLVNQQVVHELIALELLTTLLENPTDDSVEVAVGFVTECGSILQDLSPRGLHGIFERFRGILHEGEIDKRVQFLIEGLFAIRKAKFQGYPAVRPELDLVELEDQLTHEVSLLDQIDPEITLDIFKLDPQFIENEQRYDDLKKTILGDESEEEADSDAESDDDDDDEDEDSDEEDEEQMKIKDETETNLVNLRRTIYLTIMSSVDFEEAGHKLLKIKLEPGQEMELCIMLLECCSQERTYLRYYGLLGQRFCMINRIHQENFEKCFVQQYSMIHRLETNKLRNVAKFFAHLLGTDALPWHVLAYIRLTEEDTTSSSRIFIKILFQELSEHLGIRLLNERLSDPTMQDSFESIFPRDTPKNMRFAINFFTSIGLGGITENLREYLKNMPRMIMQNQAASESESDDDHNNKSDSSSSSSADESGRSQSESESSSSSEESESESSDDKRRKRRRRR